MAISPTIADINSVIAQKIGNALTFIGKSTTEIKEGLVENYIQPTINGEVVTTGKLSIGDVVLWRSERIINAGTEAQETIISDLGDGSNINRYFIELWFAYSVK